MHCPACTSDENRVLSTRSQPDKVHRLRCCDACGHRFNTTELPSQSLVTMNQAVEAVRSLSAISSQLNAAPAHS